ncbi:MULTISPECIES: retropepsin-like aspartic protease family protein [unclassified Methylobacterium]|jgi:aspartyl protease family protein|uniref:retropepsin-like aspartic protease family protein n=1 Tax=unclassified Methylobacterium TaxID=2615210 RepID=UPI00135545D1|nr:TIGR02281 family clan AA aspartic protease [Methylobacterium sp. 2A]MWV25443.1 TIGR02281 family clan AA aspartic protease [Methylobacterium sp. 2A]
MIYVGLGAIALILVALVLSDGSDSVGGVIGPDQLVSLAWTGMILILVVAGFWRQFTARLGANLRALLAWALIGLALVIGYSERDRIQGVTSQVLGAVRPGTAIPGSGGLVTIVRRADGDFRVEAEVNGRPQPFLFDTGASSVVLTAENAAALGLTPPTSEFTARVSTANGITYAAPVQLDSLSVGTITERRVNAMVAKPGALSANLLGQTFLTRLSGYEVRGDRLILSPP